MVRRQMVILASVTHESDQADMNTVRNVAVGCILEGRNETADSLPLKATHTTHVILVRQAL